MGRRTVALAVAVGLLGTACGASSDPDTPAAEQTEMEALIESIQFIVSDSEATN